MKQLDPELEEKAKQRMRKAFLEKDYDLVAKIGVTLAFCKIDSDELIKKLQEGIKEFKKIKKGEKF